MQREKRWKVSPRVRAANLAEHLNKLEAKGWTVRDIFAHSVMYFTVVSWRMVRLRSEEET